VAGQAPEEAAREREEDERNAGRSAGCFLEGLGCAFDAGIPFVLVFLWLLS
jgi:hypothetical protein